MSIFILLLDPAAGIICSGLPRNKYKSNKCGYSSGDIIENAVPVRPARAHLPIKNYHIRYLQKFKLSIFNIPTRWTNNFDFTGKL